MADVPLVHGAEALLGFVLVEYAVGSRDLRVAAGAVRRVVVARLLHGLGRELWLWPAWSAWLSPLDGTLSRTIRPALSCYLLLVGGTGDFTTTARLLRAPVEDRLGSHMTFRLTKRGHFHGISLGLLALADHLDQEGSPIDYTRRRTVDYRDLLPLDTWTQLCRDIDFEAGGIRRHQFARALLFERLSGLPATLAPPAYTPSTTELRTMLRTFETDLTPALMSQLEAHATEFLNSRESATNPSPGSLRQTSSAISSYPAATCGTSTLACCTGSSGTKA